MVSSFSRLFTLLISSAHSSYCHYTPTAPTDEAFNNITGLETIVEDIPLLTDILKYHIVPNAAVFSSQLSNGQVIDMLNEDTTQVTTGVPNTETGIKINESNVISPFDVAACNSVVHTIDKVLIPPTTSSPSSSPTKSPNNDPVSSSPSKSPSQAPSKRPTSAPSSQPTSTPTSQPSKEVSFLLVVYSVV